MKNIVNNTLLITGCICPTSSQKYLFLKDEKIRLEQYINSIEFYIKKSKFTDIVYCDNSNAGYKEEYKLKSIANSYGKNFEWLCFLGDSKQVEKKGKGYGEGEIIAYALENSKLMQENLYFTKITGRLCVKNINDLFNNNANYFIADQYREEGIDTRVYSCEISFYKKNLKNLYRDVNDNALPIIALEDIYFKSLINEKYIEYLKYPVIEGISGGNGRDYGKESKFKINLYSLMCKLRVFNIFFKYKSILRNGKNRLIKK